MKSVKSLRTATRRAAARVAPLAGQIIGERYRLEELLERGAMGSVWRAEQIRLGAPAAIKFLDPSLIGDPEMHERFIQEARSAAAVRSVHVVQILDYGSHGELPYIAMEFLAGENLDTRLSTRGTLTPAELNKIFGEVTRGLSQAHSLGVVHRDVKPGNIFLAREGEHEVTKLIDFGIAKVKADALKFTQIVGTQLGTLLGTPQYMSPEQVRGSSSVDYRTDLWALAIIACECLTGRYPFPGTTIGDLAVQICTEKPDAPSSLGPVPAGFDQWFFKGTSKKRSKRFASVEEMASSLDKILSAAAEQTRPTKTTFSAVLRARFLASVHSESWRFARPLWSRNGLFVASLVVAVCGLALSAMRHRGPAELQPEPAQAFQALRPAPADPELQPLTTVRADTLPMAEPEPGEEQGLGTVPSEPAAATSSEPAVPVPTTAPVKAPAKRPRSTPAHPPANDPENPLGPMSIAMGQAGARLAKGFGMSGTQRTRASAKSASTPGVSHPPRPATPAPTSTGANKSSSRAAVARVTPSAATAKRAPAKPD